MFMLETIQTGPNWADIHYWFVDRFSVRHRHSHYPPVDIALVVTVTLFPVQSLQLKLSDREEGTLNAPLYVRIGSSACP